jgi:cation-transporting ATPase 13A1
LFSPCELATATHALAIDKYREEIISLNGDHTSLTHCHQKYLYNADKKVYEKLGYPCYHDMEHYKRASGNLEPDYTLWGENKMALKIPLFKELLYEQIVAPFFVFQMFCSILWMMDEYWFFSLFTMGMLFMFESTVVF